MPSIPELLRAYEELCVWPENDDVDSAAWGTSTAEWYCTVLPRIQQFVPTGTILEIAPGQGRWTNFLRVLCKKLIIVDLSSKCIEACKKRFCRDTHIAYHANDGVSLDMVPDRSVDFVFSFDSLVLAEADVMEAYLTQISRKLTESGSGFIHHSNVGALPALRWFLKLSDRLGLRQRRFVQQQVHGRASSMTADLFRKYCANAGLACIRQELVTWLDSALYIDCFSTLTKSTSDSSPVCLTVHNPQLMADAKRARWLSSVYIRPGTKNTSRSDN